MFARQAVSRAFFGRHFLHSDKIPASQIPFSGPRSKMRLPPKIPHADTPPDSFHAILGNPRAKINASRLHYVMTLLEIDNIL
jgi:hypothetical protein